MKLRDNMQGGIDMYIGKGNRKLSDDISSIAKCGSELHKSSYNPCDILMREERSQQIVMSKHFQDQKKKKPFRSIYK
jgi:hypothetical protein